MGFEPMAPCGVTGFQDQLLKPLGHPSILSGPREAGHYREKKQMKQLTISLYILIIEKPHQDGGAKNTFFLEITRFS